MKHITLGFLVALCGLSLHVTQAVNPTPVPPSPDPYVFYVQDKVTGLVCLVMRLHATFHVPYNTSANKTLSTPVTLPNNTLTNATGNCSTGWFNRSGEGILFQWRPTKLSPIWNFSLSLEKSNDSQKYYISQMALQYIRTPGLFPDASDLGIIHLVQAQPNHNHTVHHFETRVGQYYECAATDTIGFMEQVTLELDSVLISAFRNKSKAIDFQGERHRCTRDSLLQNLVPIIVGVILALLIVIVLIAYLIGRRRAHAGYQSI